MINVSPQFVLAGEATFTVSNGHEHFTYKVYKTEPNAKYPNPAWFAKVLVGPDNTSDYRYMGMVKVPANPRLDPKIQCTNKSSFDKQSKVFRVAEWSLRAIWQVERKEYRLPPGYSVKHDGNCGRCGAKLTHPASLDTGLGPECAEKAGVEWAEHNQRKAQLV